MDTNTFSKQMKRLDDRFKSGKKLADSTAHVYYEELSDIPEEPFKIVIKKIISSGKFYPTPDDIRGLYSEWLREHPERIISDRVDEFCAECGGKGFLEYEIDELGHHVRIAQCKYCQNYPMANGVPKLSKQDIENLGYKIHKRPKAKGEKVRSVKNIQTLIKKAVGE